MSFHTGDGVYVFILWQTYQHINSVKIEMNSYSFKKSGVVLLRLGVGWCKRGACDAESEKPSHGGADPALEGTSPPQGECLLTPSQSPGTSGVKSMLPWQHKPGLSNRWGKAKSRDLKISWLSQPGLGAPVMSPEVLKPVAVNPFSHFK